MKLRKLNDYSKNYANELSSSNIALETINNLMDNRLELTLKLVSKSSKNANMYQLIDIGNEYNVREINIFEKTVLYEI